MADEISEDEELTQRAEPPQNTGVSSSPVTSISWIARSLWAPIAAVAVVSIKNLFEQQNYHYPFSLLFWQESLALVMALLYCITTQRLSVRSSSLLLELAKDLLDVQQLHSIIAALMLAVSLQLYMQAILHFPNLVTLLMLAVSSFASFFKVGSDSLTKGIQVTLDPLDSFFASKFKAGTAVKNVTARTIFAVVIAGVLLYDDYRLTVNGMAFGISALVCGRIAKAFDGHDDKRMVPSARGNLHIHSSRALVLALLLSLPVSVVCAWIFEPSDTNLRPIASGFYLMYLFTITIGSVALVLGGSLDVSPEEPFNFAAIKKSGPSFGHLSLDFAKLGVAAWLSTFVCQRGFTTWVQASTFVFGLIVHANNWNSETVLRYLPKSFAKGNNGRVNDTEQSNLRYFGFSRHSTYPMNQLLSSPTEGQEETIGRPSRASPGHGSLRRQTGNDTRSRLTAVAMMFLGSICCALYMYKNFQPTLMKDMQSSQLSLDNDFRAPSEFDIVISMYRESTASVSSVISQISQLDAVSGKSSRVIIYTKDEQADKLQLQQALGAFDVIQAPNVGRESETYLRHIVSKWDALAEHTLFIQADIHNPREFYPRIRDYFRSNTGMLSLGFSGNTCDCSYCGDRWGWSDQSGVLLDVYERANRMSCGPMLLSYKGQFLASAKRIRGVKKEVYEELQQAFVDPKSWAHQQTYLQGRPDSMNAPYFGYTMERLWSTLLQCSDMDIAWRCPTLLSGTRRGGDAGDCQCFDEDKSK
ncbi:MAG: hypothetical protein M1821_001250 [Bathelium mastoideum]|nr:MAG: hypothetical protein M1821_001250 [Bathelium mastoideum]